MIPGASILRVTDFVDGVTDALQGRTDITTMIPRYVRRAVNEITESYPFEELRTTGPLVSTVIGQSIYPVSLFLNPGEDYTFLDALVIYIDTPNNTISQTLDYKTPKAIEQMTSPATQGIPSRWSRYGTNIHLGPNPNAAYSMFSRYQKRHPWPDDPAADLSAWPVYIPPSWQDIIEYAAAERIAIAKRWNDQASFLHDILYGDPESRASEGKRGRPGLIAARLHQQERDQMFNTRQITPLVSRYCPR